MLSLTMAPNKHLRVVAGEDCDNPHCMGHYDFDNIARFAKRRFVDRVETLALLETATSRREREEIALVAMLDVDDDVVRDMRLECRYAGQCATTNCRERLKGMIEAQLGEQAKAK